MLPIKIHRLAQKVAEKSLRLFTGAILFMVLVLNTNCVAQPYSIFDYSNKSTLADTDGFLISETDDDYFYYTLANLKAQLSAYAFEFSQPILFNGATFQTGAEVTFEDEVNFDDPIHIGDYSYAYTLSPESAIYYSSIGANTRPYHYAYFINLAIIDPSSSDSAKITYNSTSDIVSIDKAVVIGTTKLNESGGMAPTDSAQSNLGTENEPLDTVYAQSVFASHGMAVVAQGVDGHVGPPDSIWHRGVLIKPGRLFYRQNYPLDASSTSITIKSELLVLAPTASTSGSIDTLYIGDELWTGGDVIIRVYNKSNFDVVFGNGTHAYGIMTKGATDLTLDQYDTAEFMFDSNISRWVLISTLAIP